SQEPATSASHAWRLVCSGRKPLRRAGPFLSPRAYELKPVGVDAAAECGDCEAAAGFARRGGDPACPGLAGEEANPLVGDSVAAEEERSRARRAQPQREAALRAVVDIDPGADVDVPGREAEAGDPGREADGLLQAPEDEGGALVELI